MCISLRISFGFFLAARPGGFAALSAADGPDQRRQIETQRAATFADRRPAENSQRSGFRRPHSPTATGRVPIPAADTLLLPSHTGQQSK